MPSPTKLAPPNIKVLIGGTGERFENNEEEIYDY
jgi:hypothetical protein